MGDSFVPLLVGLVSLFVFGGGAYLRYTGRRSFRLRENLTEFGAPKRRRKRNTKINPSQTIAVGKVIAGRKCQQSAKEVSIDGGATGAASVDDAFNALDKRGPGGSAMPAPDRLGARAPTALPPLRSATASATSPQGKGGAVAPARQPLPGIAPGQTSHRASIMDVGKFHVAVERAAGLAEADRFGLADPYAIVHWGASGRDEEVHRTGVMRQTLEPVWENDAGVELGWPAGLLARKQQQLRIEVWDCDQRAHGKHGTKGDKHDDFLGEVRVRAMDLVHALEEGDEGCRRVMKLLPHYGVRATDKASKFVQGDLTVLFKPLVQ